MNSCTVSDTIIIEYLPLPSLDLGEDTSLCQGASLTLVAITPDATYLWQDDSTGPSYSVDGPGSYWAEVSVNTCTVSDTIVIEYLPLPSLDLGEDTSLCLGDTLTLVAITPDATFLWQDDSTGPSYTVDAPGSYWAEVTVNSCTVSDSVLITELDCEIRLQLPNVFTPNSDGKNDLFVPISSNGITYMTTLIYNRWGTTIFETENLMIEWDGQDESEGIYFWLIQYSDIHGSKHSSKGCVTLLR